MSQILLRAPRVAGAVIAALAVLAPVAAAARPEAGTRYAGKTSQDRKIVLRISPSGDGLIVRPFRDRFNCTGVRDRTLVGSFRKDRPTVEPDGTFRYRKRYKQLRGAGLPGRWNETQRVTGSFSDDEGRVEGRLRSRITGDGFTCRSTITFTAERT